MKTESRIQQEIWRDFWNKYCLPTHEPREIMYHIPNEGKDNGRLVPLGLYPGASDLIFTWRGVHYYCEVKEPKKGLQSKSQKKFQRHVEQCGYTYFIVMSLDEFNIELEKIKRL